MPAERTCRLVTALDPDQAGVAHSVAAGQETRVCLQLCADRAFKLPLACLWCRRRHDAWAQIKMEAIFKAKWTRTNYLGLFFD